MKREKMDYGEMKPRVYDLKPCPFCGKDVADFTYCNEIACDRAECDEGFLIKVQCDRHDGGCGASSSFESSPEKATMAWNKRAKDDV